MRDKYDLAETRYVCRRCKGLINVPSDGFYWFSSTADPNFWCATCEDLPQADVLGRPADEIPHELQLPKGFILRAVPRVEPQEVHEANLLYRPYSKRSFLSQYMAWVKLSGGLETCDWSAHATVFRRFDSESQSYSECLEYEIGDECAGRPCQFLRAQVLKPPKPEEVTCSAIRLLCDVKGSFGLCQTGDEAMILQCYLLLTGGEHFPMLVPQASILGGKRRPDFVCFVPLTRFQYKWVVVLVDRPGKPASTCAKEDAEYAQSGYSVKRILVDRSNSGTSYFKAARELKLSLGG